VQEHGQDYRKRWDLNNKRPARHRTTSEGELETYGRGESGDDRNPAVQWIGMP
jgi:hypothetical protein